MKRPLTLLVVLLSALFRAAAAGQEPSTAEPAAAAAPAPATEAAAEPTAAVRELAPELYYLKDDAGRLVPVPGFGYRDFLEMFQLKEGLGGPAMPPPAILESVVVRIDARGLEAGADSCPVEVTVRARQSRGGWAMVPLGLGQVLLEGPPRHEGPGRMLVDADPVNGGYRCWFEPPPGAAADLLHTVTLTGRMPVEASESRESFMLRLPVAVASRLEVRTDRKEPRVDLQPASAARIETTGEPRGSVVAVSGLVGEVRVRIEGRSSSPATESAIEADCRSVVRIDGRSATISATLALANLPAGPRRLKITLPAQAKLRRVGGDGSLVGEQDARQGDVVTVAVEPGKDGRAAVELECERPIDPSGSTPLDPLGFAVAGIESWRQRGRVSLFVEGDWQATWDDAPGVRRVDPAAGERGAGLVAAFAYDAQPASLPLQIRPRRSRVVVEPEYRYDVSAARITLQARLRVAVRGAPVGSITIGLDPVWILRDVGPGGVVDPAGVRSEEGRITIPFLQPLAGDAVVEIEAVRAIDPAAERLDWRLPSPKADLVGPATVIVSSGSAIELLPDAAGSTGLVRQTSSALETDAAGTIAVVYRLDAPEGTFAATRRFLPRRVEAVVSARVAVDEREIDVVETIRLDVLHVPLEFLELTTARELVDSGTLEIRQQGELLEPLETEAASGTDAVGRPLALVRALLPEPLLGRGEVTVRYRLATPAVPPEATAALDLPLPLPAAIGAIRQSVSIEESAALAVVPRGDAWRRDVSSQPGAGRSWSSSRPRDILPLAISARSREAVGVTVIEAAWLRTRLFPDAREDAATYVISPAEPQLELRLPAAKEATSIEVRLDGAPVSLQSRGDNAFAIDMTPLGRGGRLLEIRSVAPWGGTVAGLGLPWPLPLDPPTFSDDVIQRRFSWELAVLPGDHVLGMPTRWTGQQRWVWQGYGWFPQPEVSSAELAGWISDSLGRPATAAASAWPLRERRSVFAGIGPPGAAAAWVVPTWFVVLIASGIALAVGQAMVTVPACRSPAALLGLLAGVAILAAAAPDTAPLVAQAALPGSLLAVLAAVLRRLTEPHVRRAPRPLAASGSSLTRSAVPTVSLIVASSLEAGSKAVVGRDAS